MYLNSLSGLWLLSVKLMVSLCSNVVMKWHIVAYIIEASICSLSLRRPLKKKESLSNNSVLLFSVSVFRSRTNSSVSPQFLSSSFNARTHAHTQTHSHPCANFYVFTLGSEWKSTYSKTYRGRERERAMAAHSRKQTDREMSKSSQDESCMQIVLLTVSFPYSLTTLPQQRYRDRPRKTEGCGERERRSGKAERKERIVSSYNRVDWRGPY